MPEHLRFAKLKGTEKPDLNALVLMLDNNAHYTTLMKFKDNKYLDLYSTGLALSGIMIVDGQLVFHVNVADILTVNEANVLSEFVSRVNNK